MRCSSNVKGEIFDCLGSSSEQTSLWDDLLSRCNQGRAACRVDVLASFQANFCPQSKLIAVVAKDSNGELAAALPLLLRGGKRPFSSATSVANEWCQCGQLLLSPTADSRSALLTILDVLADLKLNSIWLDWIAFERPEWEQFRNLSQQRGWGCQVRPKFDVGITRLPESWSEFESSLSKNSRKRTRSELKRLNQKGAVQLEVVAVSQPSELASKLREAFEIEHRSWKGAAGSAIICDGNVRAFFLNTAHSLNRTGHFRLFFLRLNEQSIAFDLGEQNGNEYRSWKISYLPEYADYSPGHVLNQLVIRYFIENTTVTTCDSVGPLTDAIRRWSNGQYRLGRMLLAPDSWLRNPTGHSLVQTLRARDQLRTRGFSSYVSNKLRFW